MLKRLGNDLFAVKPLIFIDVNVADMNLFADGLENRLTAFQLALNRNERPVDCGAV